MALRVRLSFAESYKKRSLARRMIIVHGALLFIMLLIVARLLELQVFDRSKYEADAQQQHFRGVVLPARRGEVYALNSKTNETTILATNSTLDMVYVDPLITDDATSIAEKLADILITDDFHRFCGSGSVECPRELVSIYAGAFDPLSLANRVSSGSLLEPLPDSIGALGSIAANLPDLAEARRLFARTLESRISDKRVRFTPLLYSATKKQIADVEGLLISGVFINREDNLVYADPEQVDQSDLDGVARKLSPIIELDPEVIREYLRSRYLRYVPVMRRLPPELSLRIRQVKLDSIKDTSARKLAAPTRKDAEMILDPLRSIALIPEHWRYYPDGTLASQVVGFLNTNKEAQYGVERTFDAQLRGQEGLISSVKDPQGGQILTSEQTIIDPKDGDSVVLTIDPFIQREVERIMSDAREQFKADSGQAIVMDPMTGRILAMVNVPLFDRNSYGSVYDKNVIFLPEGRRKDIVVELFHPVTNARVVKAYWPDLFTQEGRKSLSEKTQETIREVESLYDLAFLTRYYLYLGENTRLEIFPTEVPGVWMKYQNTIGVGAYLNRTIQEIYEPGSVLKPITMAIAIDQGEVAPGTIYDDKADVRVDEYTIKNALLIHYGKVTMTNCLEFSINTCMTSVSERLGKKLFHRMLERFGFGRITGIELDDELPGEILPWRDWSNALLATASFGQGISATPLQMVTAFAVLANGGKLLRPTIIDSIRHSDGSSERLEPKIVEQVITEESSQTITAMLVSSVEHGYAKTAKVPWHYIAGKTGTSQIAGPGGKYESGTGSTFNTFVGYAPPDNPRFIAIVKFDRAKIKQTVHGAATAAPTFKQIAAFLFKYYGLPPDSE
jgi:cell division protein FtsI/penicillin-binding protein 2